MAEKVRVVPEIWAVVVVPSPQIQRILTTIDFGRFYAYGCQQDSDFTIATKNVGTPFNFGKVHTAGDRIIRVEEKPQFLTEVLAGIYFMKPPILDLVPDGEYFGIPDLIDKMIALGRPIMRYLMQEYWLDIGRVEDYGEAEEAYRIHFKGQ